MAGKAISVEKITPHDGGSGGTDNTRAAMIGSGGKGGV